ncbi:MAG: GNAT family N-acetyltransferase [Deltaproteobacteria bacterium]|nr:MAG: GNAT family N-acetyltransferase [Deltaproteobacteria bacterium]
MIEIRTFDGNFKEVHKLIRASWLEDYREKYKQPVIDYSSIDFLEWNLRRPTIDPDLVLGAYHKGKLVGFVACLPHTLKYNDQTLKAASSSFFTTHIDYKGQGIGRLIITTGLLKGMEKGYDINVFVPDEGHLVEKFIEKLSAEISLRFLKLHRFTFLTKPLNKNRIKDLADLPIYQKIALNIIAPKRTRKSKKSYSFDHKHDVKIISQMLERQYSQNTLSVMWTEELLLFNLKSEISDTFFLNSKDKGALINYYNIDVLGSTALQKSWMMTMIDNVCFENMSFYEKHKFVNDFSYDQKDKGSCLISIPTTPIFDLKPFYSNLYYPSGRYHWFCIHDFNHRLRGPVNIGHLFFR